MFIPDPGSDFFSSRIPDPNCFKYFNPKKSKKWFLSSKKYDPGCSSRIPDPDADYLPSRIPDPGVKKAPNPGSRIRIRNTGYKYAFWMLFTRELASHKWSGGPGLITSRRHVSLRTSSLGWSWPWSSLSIRLYFTLRPRWLRALCRWLQLA